MLHSRLRFQCSSASRKFLNRTRVRRFWRSRRVSVLFSEPKISQLMSDYVASIPPAVSVLFSEPKISQCRGVVGFPSFLRVSVLFSEPKISQCDDASTSFRRTCRFSALQRAENFSIARDGRAAAGEDTFQCSSASRKFLNPDPRTCIHPYSRPR